MIMLHIANLSVEEKMKLAKLILSAIAILFASLSVGTQAVAKLAPATAAATSFAPQEASTTASAPVTAATKQTQSVTDQVKQARMQGYEGESCPECQNFTLVRNGTCLKCNTCGSTTGCS